MNRARAGCLVALLAACFGCSRREPVGAPHTESRAAPGKAAANAANADAANAPALSVAAAPASAVAPANAAAPAERLPAEQRTWVFEAEGIGRMVAVVVLPERDSHTRWPVLLAFHGMGEALKGPDRGARGWLDDYALERAMKRLSAPPLRAADFESFVAPERLSRLNASLVTRPFRGLIVVCSYTPDMLRGDEPFEKAPPLARFVTETLLPKVASDVPSLGASATGIDGVSLGGRAAFGVGLLAPRSFRAIAGLQAAFDVEHAEDIATRAQAAYAANPALVFRVLTSTGDFFRPAGVAMARAMQKKGLPAELLVVEGPHDYAFNRGPGAIEMLLYHDRVLRGEAAL
jgi:enterochelin esterase-like enzyme